jgi:hypothetical protein
MARLYLPVDHTEADLILAGQIAERIDSAELYVAWTADHGTSVPEVPAELRAPAPDWTDTLTLLVQAVRALLCVLLGRPPQQPAPRPAGPGGRPTEPRSAAGEAAA